MTSMYVKLRMWWIIKMSKIVLYRCEKCYFLIKTLWHIRRCIVLLGYSYMDDKLWVDL